MAKKFAIALALIMALAIAWDSHAKTPVEQFVQRAEGGWIGQYAKRDDSVKKLLSSSEGWTRFRDMDLFESIRFFSSSTDPASRVGAARSYLELAEAFDALDGFFMDVETQYLDEMGMEAASGQRARLGFCFIRRGKLSRAKEVFGTDAPKDRKLHWALGKIAMAAASGQKIDPRDELKRLGESASKDNKAFVRVFAYTLGIDLPLKDTGYYGQALTAIKSGDLFSSMVALQMLDNAGNAAEPGADIYLYYLLREVFAKMAVEAVKTLDGAEAAYLLGQAKLLLGDADGAAEAFARARQGTENPAAALAARMLGPELDRAEAKGLAAVYEGLALSSAKKNDLAAKAWQEIVSGQPGGDYVKARLAAVAAEAGIAGVVKDPSAAASDALSGANELGARASKMQGAEMASRLLDARAARVARDAAAVARKAGKQKEALDVLSQAHVKRQGNKPSFINPPSFFVDLARAYSENGEFAPAVEILFELSNQYSSSRTAYESLKRLYASTTGGGAPPR